MLKQSPAYSSLKILYTGPIIKRINLFNHYFGAALKITGNYACATIPATRYCLKDLSQLTTYSLSLILMTKGQEDDVPAQMLAVET